MANSCHYYMNIYGEVANIREFIRAMRHEGEYTDGGVGRVFSCDEIVHYITCLCEGDCAWSVLTAMRNGSDPNNIEKLSKRLHLDIEVYSSEYGVGFEEHFVVSDGNVIVDECVDAYTWSVDDIDDDFFENKMVIDAGITRDNYEDFIVDDYITVGGYKDWWFEYVYDERYQ